MRVKSENKRLLDACVEYVKYRGIVFSQALSEFNAVIAEMGEVIHLERRLIATYLQNKLYEELGLAFANRQKELFKEAGLTYGFNQQKVKKEKAKNKTPKRDRVEPYSSFGKAFKAQFGFGSKGNMQLYHSCYTYYRQTGKYLWESDSWNTIKTKFDLED